MPSPAADLIVLDTRQAIRARPRAPRLLPRLPALFRRGPAGAHSSARADRPSSACGRSPAPAAAGSGRRPASPGRRTATTRETRNLLTARRPHHSIGRPPLQIIGLAGDRFVLRCRLSSSCETKALLMMPTSTKSPGRTMKIASTQPSVKRLPLSS
jgi:hypothetical protein